MSGCIRSIRAMAWDSSSLHSVQNDMTRAPLCHSERSEESKSLRPLSAQVYPHRSLRFYVQPVSLACQDVYVAFAQWLGILRRFTPQNDMGARPSVILNAVKNPRPPTTQRSGLSTQDSPILCAACESRFTRLTCISSVLLCLPSVSKAISQSSLIISLGLLRGRLIRLVTSIS